jgi:outer membrane protein OmpA-like peptidoglycan-associated protein
LTYDVTITSGVDQQSCHTLNLSCSFNGLITNHQYSFKVTVSNDAGTSDAATTSSTVPEFPLTPTGTHQTEILPGGPAMIISANGETRQAPVVVISPSTIQVVDPATALALQVGSADSKTIVTPQSLEVTSGETTLISGSGYAPFTQVAIYAFSTAYFLGYAMTDASGRYARPVTFPPELHKGNHTLQTQGISKKGVTKALAAPFHIVEPSPPSAPLPKLSLYFATGSSGLGSRDLSNLSNFIAALGRTKVKSIFVYGFSSRTGNQARNQQLSLSRARFVANFVAHLMKKLHINATFTVRGLGVSTSFKPILQNQRVDVTLSR